MNMYSIGWTADSNLNEEVLNVYEGGANATMALAAKELNKSSDVLYLGNMTLPAYKLWSESALRLGKNGEKIIEECEERIYR